MSAWWNLRGRKRDTAAAALQTRLGALRSDLHAQLARGELLVAQARVELDQALDANRTSFTDVLDEWSRPELAGWDAEAWAAWSPDTTFALPELRVGRLREVDTGVVLDAPIVVPVHTGAGPVVLVSRTLNERLVAAELLQSMVVRAAACFPKQARFALLDPSRRGAAFPMSRRLERVLLGLDNLDRTLDELSTDVARIETSYLDRRHPTLDQVSATLRLAESRQFLVAAAFPTSYDERSVETVLSLAARGARAGVHVIIDLDLHSDPSAAAVLDGLAAAGAIVLELGGTPAAMGGISGEIDWDESPTGAVQEIVFQKIAATPRRDLPVKWDDVQDLSPSEWWSDSTDELAATPIGRAGADQVYELWFGAERQLARACTHGIAIGPARGREALFGSLVGGLAVRYSPDELRLTLVNGREHPTFEQWRRLPHLEVLALSASSEQARGVLADLRARADRRLHDLQRLGHESYERLRAKPSEPYEPRLIAIFDHADQLFDGDHDDSATGDLRRLLEIGERAGVHVILGGARFDRFSELHRAGLFELIDLRVALELERDDSMGRDEFGIKGVQLIGKVCDRPYRAVVNSMRGHDDGNLAAQLADFGPAQLEHVLDRLTAMMREREDITGPIVLNGLDQPLLADNPHLRRLAELDPLRRSDEVGRYARTSPDQGGLGITEWDPSEHPRVVFIGNEERLREHAHFVLRRRPTENVALVMADRDLRTGTLTSLLVSVVLSGAPDDIELWIIDRASPTSPGADVINQTVRRLAALDVPCRLTRSGEEAADFIRAVGQEIGRRRALGEAEIERQSTVLLVVSEPERIGALSRVPTMHGSTDSELGLDLRYVLVQGPTVGVHVVLSTSSLAAARTVLSEHAVHQEFRHRLVTHVAEEDSYVLVRSARASNLASGPITGSAALVVRQPHAGRAGLPALLGRAHRVRPPRQPRGPGDRTARSARRGAGRMNDELDPARRQSLIEATAHWSLYAKAAEDEARRGQRTTTLDLLKSARLVALGAETARRLHTEYRELERTLAVARAAATDSLDRLDKRMTALRGLADAAARTLATSPTAKADQVAAARHGLERATEEVRLVEHARHRADETWIATVRLADRLDDASLHVELLAARFTTLREDAEKAMELMSGVGRMLADTADVYDAAQLQSIVTRQEHLGPPTGSPLPPPTARPMTAEAT